ncbi:MAG: hypothetical protein KAJ93_02975 [Methanosarcinales archaeon]|nr:hypothetical protein [Methanosarcinales archaeon]
MRNKLHHMTQYQRTTAKQKVVRLTKINQFYKDNQDASINTAVTFIPESALLVQQYSKLRRELVIDGGQKEIAATDIEEYVYGVNPCRYRQVGR